MPSRIIWIASVTCVFSCFVMAVQNPSNSKPVVFVSHYLERADADTTPRPAQLTSSVSVAAAPGEYEPATISVRSGGQPLKNVFVKLSGDFRSEAGDVIPAAAVQIRLAEPFERWKDRPYKTMIDDVETEAHKQQEMFLPLLKTPLDIPAHTTRRFWLTIRVPDSAQPGTYRSTINVAYTSTAVGPDLGRSVNLSVLDYELAVLPINVATAAQTGMAFFMYNDTTYYPDELITAEYQKRVCEDMRAHGMTTAVAHLYPNADEAVLDLTARAERHLSFTESMGLFVQTGLVNQGIPMAWIGAGSYGPSVWTAVMQERIRQSWPEIIFYAVDEPEEEDRNALVRAFMQQFNTYRRQNPNYNLRVTTAIGSSRGVQTAGHHYDLWIGCMAQETGETGLIADARMMGKQLWTYDCMLAPVDAETDRYYFGVWAWVAGVNGCSHWAYYDGQPRLSYVYPATDEIIPTVGWEAVREGIDDYRYLFTLQRLADAVRAAGKAELLGNTDRIFEDVKSMVTMDNYGRAYHQAALSQVPVATAYQRPRIEPDLDIAAYDHLHQRVAQEIQILQRGLSEKE